ncbi:MAG: DUF5686 and carboxypeptidase regulatory-like domain-containing protein [Chitinophagales bacterium]|nr:DUF5686 and carboxypeptidase regulatory-like domain-containing protein [Chitinophagales bacterium]
MKLFLFPLLFFCCCINLHAGIIQGKLTDEKDQPLSYATIYLKNTTIGTTSNDDGFYSIIAPAGEYEIVFQYIGYKKYSQKVLVVNEILTVNISLKKESIELKEIVVDANAEDPAYAIIRKAQKKRKYYLDQVYSYSCNVYMKGIQGLTTIPEKVMGFNTAKKGLDSTKLGILYLSESESQYNFERTNKVKEIVYSSKVSGDNNAFSWNSAAAFSSNFYENLIPLGGITPRGLVSPIAESALLFYKYKLLGSFYEDGLLINKIQVLPKRKTDPVFSGIIYITEDWWNIHSIDLLVTKEAHLDFIDSLRFTETYNRVNDTAWMPINQVLQFNFAILGIKGDGKFIGVFSNYNLAPGFSKDFFDAERLRVNDDANKKDSLYWEDHRPVPLTITEKTDYKKKDSLHVVENSKPFLDSVDKKNNKFKIQDVLLGYNYQNSFHKLDYKWKNPLLGLSYNIVEGLNITLRNSLTKEFEDRRKWNINGDLRYGFSNKKLGARTSFTYDDDLIHQQQWHFEAGIFPTQINGAEPISELVNAGYTLVANQNFMKLYEKRFVAFQHRREWFNGFQLATVISYSDRSPLENSTDYSFDWVGDNSFTPNNYFNNPNADTLMRTQAIVLNLKANIAIGQTYVSRPGRRIITGSKFPTFSIQYSKGIHVLGSDVNFDLLEAGITHDFDFGLVGSANLNFNAGTFLSNKEISFIDYKHFQANQTIFGAHYQNGFQLLQYFDHSTNQSWLEGHYEHHFGGFIFNKIPLIKKLNLQEVAGAHALLTNDLQYIELDFGIEHLFKVLRVDYVASFGNDGKLHSGFLVGFSLNGAISLE